MKHFSSLFKVGLLVGLVLSFASPAAAQAPAWQSAQTIATATAAVGGSFSQVRATAVDAAGNVYLAGYFTNSVVLGGTTLTSLGGQDVFVTKFSPVSNQVVWAQRAGGIGQDGATALAVSGTSVYVAGFFASPTASFGTTTLTNASVGPPDAFVTKLTDEGPTGSFVWAQRAGGTARDEASALAITGTSVYVAGFFDSPTASFGSSLLTNAGSVGSRDVFVAKLTDAGPTGSFTWAQRAGGTDYDFATTLAVSGTSVYAAGGSDSPTASFGSTTLVNAGTGYDVFVAKLTDAGPTGSFAWAQRAGGTGNDFAYALAANGTSVYVAGEFVGPTASFGSSLLTNAGSVGSGDGFVAKLIDAGPAGSFAWAQRAGGTGGERAVALAISGMSVYVAGYFSSPTVSFGSTTLVNAGSMGSGDVFVAKLADVGPAGSFVWAQRAGGTDFDFATALAVSGTSVYAVGNFNSPTASFGTTTLFNPNPGDLGFLASLTDPTLTATTAGRALASAQLFPNPAHRTATLRLPAGTPAAPLTLTDALGRAVRRYPAPAGPETALDLGGLPAGLYLLRGAGPARRLAVE